MCSVTILTFCNHLALFFVTNCCFSSKSLEGWASVLVVDWWSFILLYIGCWSSCGVYDQNGLYPFICSILLYIIYRFCWWSGGWGYIDKNFTDGFIWQSFDVLTVWKLGHVVASEAPQYRMVFITIEWEYQNLLWTRVSLFWNSRLQWYSWVSLWSNSLV